MLYFWRINESNSDFVYFTHIFINSNLQPAEHITYDMWKNNISYIFNVCVCERWRGGVW